MNLLPTISASVNVSGIQQAVGLAIKSTSRKLELLLADTAFYAAVKTQAYTPYVELGTIDRELETTVQVGKSATNHMTLGQAIVLARMNPTSKYNRVTGGRWALPRPPLDANKFEKAYGDASMARKTFWEIVNNAAERQRKARRSSTHFLQSGWKGVFKKIKALGLRGSKSASQSIRAQNNSLNTMSTSKVDSLGAVQRAGMGTSSQWIRIENLIGTDGGPLAAEHNAASLAYGIPALQRGVDEQAQDMRTHYLPKVGAELAAEWNSVPDAPAYQKGFHDSKVRWAETEAAGELETLLG